MLHFIIYISILHFLSAYVVFVRGLFQSYQGPTPHRDRGGYPLPPSLYQALILESPPATIYTLLVR